MGTPHPPWGTSSLWAQCVLTYTFCYAVIEDALKVSTSQILSRDNQWNKCFATTWVSIPATILTLQTWQQFCLRTLREPTFSKQQLQYWKLEGQKPTLVKSVVEFASHQMWGMTVPWKITWHAQYQNLFLWSVHLQEHSFSTQTGRFQSTTNTLIWIYCLDIGWACIPIAGISCEKHVQPNS